MATARNRSAPPARRAVIVAGARTPFVRAFGDFIAMSTIDLGATAVRGLLRKTDLPWAEIDAVFWSGVILPSSTVNVGREIVLELGLPPTIEANTVTRACTSSVLSTTNAVAAIERGEVDVVIAGGSDSTSNAELKMPQTLMRKAAPVFMSKKATAADYFKLLGKLDLRADLIPERPAVRERATGELMGESCEKMAEMNGITREAQDRLAVQSHHRAAAAAAAGRFVDEIVPVETKAGKRVLADNLVRADVTEAQMARLKPVFKRGGTLTAGNSSALTDGAAAVLLMSEEKARALGYTPLAFVRSWSYGAVDPFDQLLIGPAFTMPLAVERAGLTLDEIDLVDIHEAFAAQVLSVLKALGSAEFGKQRLGLEGAFGRIAPESINVHGGSVALGHPFAATGARMLTTMANELHQTKARHALLGLCAAGGLSAAVVLEKA